MQSGKYHSPDNLQTQTHPSDCQTEKYDWSASNTLHCTWCTWWLSFCCSQLLPLCYNTTNS
ncbi:unnamed protein product [Staurois parvus]|uniref:Uncharacterized protein n=1 Tax=Staurois parvus TaxID=386267 RepID=A0ABN9F246_9NEOB|nr:unnamed protein product [Staurois parvus]